jgi:uncharacterized membrane protein YidH (DUF202 family)
METLPNLKQTVMETNTLFPTNENAIIINEAQLILAEKRTHLAMLRTGIAIIALPMTLVSFLIATSRLYFISDVLMYMIPLFILCSGLLGLGGYLVFRSVVKLHQDARFLEQLKTQNSILSKLMD